MSRVTLIAAAAVLSGATVFAQVAPFAGGQGGQMPDPKQISGVPLPVNDVPAGTVTVRVIRGQLTNTLPGQTVTLTGAGAARNARTDDAGRATFSDLPAGSHLQAKVTVDGETVESREFDVPASGGIRLMLVATDKATDERAAQDKQLAQGPAVEGTVALGEQSRLVLEIGDDALNVFNIMQVVNTAKRPVKMAGPLAFDLPPGAVGAGLLEGSPANATVANKKVVIPGPFAPGATVVQFAYSLPLGPETLRFTQHVPVPMLAVSVIAQNAGGMHLESPQLAGTRDMSADGQSFIVGQGGAVAAGDGVTIALSGLPHRPVWPKDVALTLAGLILAWGAWAAVSARGGSRVLAAAGD